MPAVLEREAVITDGQLHCPWCGSADVIYAEDVTARHAVVRIEDGVIRLELDSETDDLTSNERIICNQCNESSGLPEGYDTDFEC